MTAKDVSICNFRDAGGFEVWFEDPILGISAHGHIKSSIFFRSSSIDRATPADAKIITESLKIKSLIDLRTAEFSGARGPNLTSFYELAPKASKAQLRKDKKSKKAAATPQLPLSPMRGSSSANPPLAALPTVPSDLALDSTSPTPQRSRPPHQLSAASNPQIALDLAVRPAKPPPSLATNPSQESLHRLALDRGRLHEPSPKKSKRDRKRSGSVNLGPRDGLFGFSGELLNTVGILVDSLPALELHKLGDDSRDNYGFFLGDLSWQRISQVDTSVAAAEDAFTQPALERKVSIAIPRVIQRSDSSLSSASLTIPGGASSSLTTIEEEDDDDAAHDEGAAERGDDADADVESSTDSDLPQRAISRGHPTGSVSSTSVSHPNTSNASNAHLSSAINNSANNPAEDGDAEVAFENIDGLLEGLTDECVPSISSNQVESLVFSNAGFIGTCYRHGLVGRAFKTAIVNATPKKAMAKAAKAYMLGRGPEEYRKAIVGPLFNHHDGIERLYRMFVDFCKEEIGRCLTAIASEIQHPFVVYCNHGKDRTGWICALIHHVCGVPRPQIIANYAVSDENLEPIAAMTEEEMRSGGLDPKILCRSPAKAMEATFDYVEATFGSVEHYLDAIGFTAPLRAQLRSRLVDIEESTPLLVAQPVTSNIPDRSHLAAFTPIDADAHGNVTARTNATLSYSGELQPGRYQLSVEGLDLWIDPTAMIQILFQLTAPDAQVLTATALHQSSSTTVTRPFSLGAPSTFSLVVTCTAAAPADVHLRLSIRPYPFISALPTASTAKESPPPSPRTVEASLSPPSTPTQNPAPANPDATKPITVADTSSKTSSRSSKQARSSRKNK